jgi:hypothetical protein
MSNAKQSKVTKTTAAAVETAKECIVVLAQLVQDKDTIAVTSRDVMAKLVKTKVTIGDLRVCAIAQFFRDTLCAMVNPGTKKPYTAQSASNYLSAIRTAIKTGNDLNLNVSRTKAKSAGQSKTPKSKDKAALVEPNVMEDDDTEMATDEGKTPAIKPGAFKSNDDAIAALKTAIKNVKASCTLKQWEAIQTLYPQLGKLID